MTNTTKRQFDANVYAVLHRAGRDWRGIIIRSNSGSPELLDSREFPRDRTGQIESWLNQRSVSRVTCILPASAVICRTCPLPDAPMEQLEPALRLQAEAHLLGIAPAHRLGMAVLDQAPGESAREGLILAWPESSDVELPPVNRPITFTPDIAALAALINGHRPTQPLLWLDRADGSIALAVSHAGGIAFRSVCEDGDDSEAWQESIGRVVAETTLSVGHTDTFVQTTVNTAREAAQEVGPDQGVLHIPQEITTRAHERLQGSEPDEQWWSKYGIAAGAVLVQESSLAPLARMEHAAPEETTSPIKAFVDKLSQPRMATKLAVAAVLILMFGPLAVNWARMVVLEIRHADIDEKLALVNNARNSLVVYRELGNTAWPMTKILADIASNTPEGVELESIRINPGRTFTVRGRALPQDEHSAPELVVLMQQYLRESNIFNEITLHWGDSDAYGNYDFELSARLLNPYRRHQYPEDLDFANLTLAERMYGPSPERLADSGETTPQLPGGSLEVPAQTRTVGDRTQQSETRETDGARASANAERSDPYAELYDPAESRETSRLDRPLTSRAGGGIGGDAETRESTRGQGGVGSHHEIPEPITKDQIRALSESEVMDMLIRVGNARRSARNRGDDELYSRLQQEFNWLMAQRRGDL